MWLTLQWFGFGSSISRDGPIELAQFSLKTCSQFLVSSSSVPLQANDGVVVKGLVSWLIFMWEIFRSARRKTKFVMHLVVSVR